MTENMNKSKNQPGEVSPIQIVSARSVLKTTPNTKSLRKASETQKDLMIEYFETHRGAIEVVSSNNTDSEVKRKIWEGVTKILNDVEGGSKKNSLKWAKTWADMKLYTKNRARAAKNKHIAVHARKPSALDRRILKVTGHDSLLRDWEASLSMGEFVNTTTYNKIQVEDPDEQELVVTEGTDYEYIDEDEIVNEESSVQEAIRIEHYYDTRNIVSQYEYSEPVDEQQNKRKRLKEEAAEVLEYQEAEGDEDEDETLTAETPVKRQKRSYEEGEEEVSREESDQEEKHEPDPMVGAINNLANALQSVASAISSFAEIAKGLNKR